MKSLSGLTFLVACAGSLLQCARRNAHPSHKLVTKGLGDFDCRKGSCRFLDVAWGLETSILLASADTVGLAVTEPLALLLVRACLNSFKRVRATTIS
eukprot:3958010-Amphidinium_carterae.1